MGKWHVFSVLLALIATALRMRTISADCTLNMDGTGNWPLISADFGSRRMLQRQRPTHTFSNEQLVHVYCATSTEIRQDHYSGVISLKKKVELLCSDEEWLVKSSTPNYDLGRTGMYISCTPGTESKLYESHTNLPECPPSLTYVIAGPSGPNFNDIAKIGICYNVDNMAHKYAHYVAYRSQLHTTDDTNDGFPLAEMTLDVKLPNPSTAMFMSESAFNSSLEVWQNTRDALSVHSFDWASVLQDPLLQDDITLAVPLLSIAWWRNLRLGNWRTFLQALTERTQTSSSKYVVYTGSSGAIQLPKQGPCGRDTMLSFNNRNVEVTAPEYIWSYLKSIDSADKEEFVVIGHNSPFYKMGQNVTFCKDMCDDIHWLVDSPLNYTRWMPTLGVVFCCKPNDVDAKFAPFPWKPMEEDNTEDITAKAATYKN